MPAEGKDVSSNDVLRADHETEFSIAVTMDEYITIYYLLFLSIRSHVEPYIFGRPFDVKL
jgi:hypothetical protein